MSGRGINILFRVGSGYRIDRKRVKGVIAAALAKLGVVEDYEVSVLVCGERKMRELHRRYLGGGEYQVSVGVGADGKDQGLTVTDELHDVLAFPLEGEKSPEGVLLLGDIVLCYPQVVAAAAEHNRLVDEEIDFLVEHACSHLLGIHHL